MNASTYTLGSPLIVPYPPSAVALSPDDRFLVVGEYQTFQGIGPPQGGLTIFDLSAGSRQDITLGNAVLAASFGAGSQALLVTTGGFLALDPLTGNIQTLLVSPLPGVNLPVPFATFPPNIIQTSVGVSGDGNRSSYWPAARRHWRPSATKPAARRFS
jgi:hypothetical protein